MPFSLKSIDLCESNTTYFTILEHTKVPMQYMSTNQTEHTKEKRGRVRSPHPHLKFFRADENY